MSSDSEASKDRASAQPLSLFDRLRELVAPVLPAVSENLPRLDLEGRRFFMPDIGAFPALRWAIEEMKDVKVHEITANEDGFRVRATVQGRVVGALLSPQSVRWVNGVVVVKVLTPEGMQSYDRSFAMACVIAYTTLFGGTPLVGFLMDQLVPRGWAWDGAVGTWSRDVVGAMDAPEFVRSATGAELVVHREATGTWFALAYANASLDITDLAKYLGGLALRRG